MPLAAGGAWSAARTMSVTGIGTGYGGGVYWANHRSSLAEINSAVFSSFIFNAFATRAAIVWARNTAFRRRDWGLSPLFFLRLRVRCPLRRTLGPFSLPAHTV